MTNKLFETKKFIVPILLTSLVANIVFLMILVPIDSTQVGCLDLEKRLSLINNGYERMKLAKLDAIKEKESISSNMSQGSLPFNGLAEGAKPCTGSLYKLYIL